VLQVMEYGGFILVAIFYFISGYGLVYGLQHKTNYLHGFLKKRLIHVLLPYWMVNVVLIIIYIILGKNITPLDIVLTLLGLDMITGTWFVTSILIMYILFYISFMLSKRIESDELINGATGKCGLIFLTVFVLIYCACCLLLNLNSVWTASISAFLFGCYYHKFRDDLEAWFRKKWGLKFLISLAVFSFLYVGRLVLAYKGIDNEYLHFIIRNIVSSLFIVVLLCMTQKIVFVTSGWRGKLLCGAGIISFELYIVHSVLLQATDFWVKEWWYSVALMGTAICISIIIRWTSNTLLKKLFVK